MSLFVLPFVDDMGTDDFAAGIVEQKIQGCELVSPKPNPDDGSPFHIFSLISSLCLGMLWLAATLCICAPVTS